MPTTDTDTKKQEAEGFLSRLFTGWGIPGSIARILAGALVGAVAAWLALSQSGCTANYTQTAEGIQFRGAIVTPEKTAYNHHVNPDQTIGRGRLAA